MFFRRSFALILLALPLAAQTKPKPSLSEALIQARTSLVLSEGRFSQAGGEVLTQAVAHSQFVLLGEDHITREIPQFAAALCDVVHPDAYAVEAGPQAAQFVNGLLHSPDRIARVSERIKLYPNGFAFLDIRDENDLAAHCAAASRNPDFQLLGLDQEFLGSAGSLLDAMMATQPGPKSRTAIASAQAKEHKNELEARRSGDPGKLFLLSATDADLKPLQEAIAADGQPATQTLLREFVASHAIYRLNALGSPDSNRVRAQLLKRHFFADYKALQTTIPRPKVLFKFGDEHVGMGFDDLHQRDLGNFVAELADGEGAQSLHILVLGSGGTHATFGGYAKPLGREPFVMTDDPGYKWLAPAVAALLPAHTENNTQQFTLFDLRQLRFRGIDLPRDWERVIYQFDLFVFIPELTPASAIE